MKISLALLLPTLAAAQSTKADIHARLVGHPVAVQLNVSVNFQIF